MAGFSDNPLRNFGFWLAGRLPGRRYLAEVLNNRGNVLRDSQRVEDALACYERALQLNPGHVKAHYNRGNSLLGLQRPGDALASYDRALQLKPDYADAHYNRGIALQHLGRPADAVASYDRALAFKPDDAEALNNRGNALLDLRRSDDALASYDRALAIRPDYADAHANRGNALRDLRRSEDAIASYDRAVAIRSSHADALYNRGHALADIGRKEAAVASYQQAISINPDYVEARWSLVMAGIPKIAAAHENLAASREEFSRGLADLEAHFDSKQHDGHDVVGVATPFYLAYQEENNRELLAAYGRLCAKLMKRWRDKQTISDKPGNITGTTVRVGIVSAFVRNHSVWNAIVKGWLRHLDRKAIELHVFCLGVEKDEETDWARSSVQSFAQGGKGLREWVETIAGKHLDILIYPEIGMDPTTVKLASLRLAPIQMAAWGHPETTGLPTIDYYLSADAFEPPGHNANYTEKLVALPNLGSCYTQPTVADVDPDLVRQGIASDGALFICPGAPFKYAPQYDFVFVEIARRLGKCRFVFFTWQIQALSELLRRRLEACFRDANLNFSDYGVFVPWQATPGFYGLMKRADVFLDTIGFSGFNTAMQAVECNLPIVAGDGTFMRGRLASGILRRMGMHELIAATAEEYIGLAVQIAREPAYRQQVRDRMKAAQHVLFDDVSSVHALQKLLVKVAR